jgi:hypothetical protein
MLGYWKHKRKGTVYKVIATNLSVKIDGIWYYDMVLYHQDKHPDIPYSRREDDFNKSFERI